MTPEQIQELREREAAATEGPWEADELSVTSPRVRDYYDKDICQFHYFSSGCLYELENHEANIAFIATIRNNATELLDRAERANELEVENEMLRSRENDAISQALTERDYWRAKFENLARESAHSDELAFRLIEVAENDIKRLRAELAQAKGEADEAL